LVTQSIQNPKVFFMRNTILRLAALSLAIPTGGLAIAAPADAATTRHHYSGRTAYAHKYCRRSPASTGAVAGGIGGAVVGSQVLHHGLLGFGAGAIAGVVAGKAIDRTLTAKRRCYYR
jgi:hypothetical protein